MRSLYYPNDMLPCSVTCAVSIELTILSVDEMLVHWRAVFLRCRCYSMFRCSMLM